MRPHAAARMAAVPGFDQNPEGAGMRSPNIGTQRLVRTVTTAALAAFVFCGAVGILATPIFAGNAERDVLPTGKGIDEVLKEAKPPNPAGTEVRPPCARPRDPWTICKNHELYQCRQALSHFGTAICNYRDSCRNSHHYC